MWAITAPRGLVGAVDPEGVIEKRIACRKSGMRRIAASDKMKRGHTEFGVPGHWTKPLAR